MAENATSIDPERFGADTDLDSDTEQQLPMMHHARAGAPHPFYGKNNNAQSDCRRDPKQPPYPEREHIEEDMEKHEPVQPVGFMCWIGFGCTIFGVACICIAFASPYWVQAYPNSFNTFRNVGLWEVCMNGYMHHKDYAQEIYSGCWWVFNRDPKFWKLHEWLLPPWMIAVQVLVIGSLLMFCATAVTIAFLILHCCPIMNHEYHQTYALFSAAAMMFLTTLSTLVGAVVYGMMCQDREWMPNPQYNFLSWGFGFFIISGMAALGAGITFYLGAKRAYKELIDREVVLAKNIMETVGWDPNDSQPPQYGDYGDQGGYNPEHPGYNQPYNQNFGLPEKS